MKTKTGTFHVSGYPFIDLSTRQKVSKELKVGDEVRLLSITDNMYDEEAIAVLWNGLHIGWHDKHDKGKRKLFNKLLEDIEVTAQVVAVSSLRVQHAVIDISYSYTE